MVVDLRLTMTVSTKRASIQEYHPCMKQQRNIEKDSYPGLELANVAEKRMVLSDVESRSEGYCGQLKSFLRNDLNVFHLK